MAAVKKGSVVVGAPAKGKAQKAKNTSSVLKKVRDHPPYVKMIEDAIVTLNERTGSSLYAIAKVMEEKQKSHLPPNFKKMLLLQLKKLVAAGKLVKVKYSFKLPPKSSLSNGVSKPAEAKAKVPSKSRAIVEPKSKSVKPTVAVKSKPSATERKVKSKQTKTEKSLAVKSPAMKKKKAPVKTVKKPKSVKTPSKKAPVKK